MDPVEKCKNVWKAAKSDTERFGALYVIAKILGENDIPDCGKKDIFYTIGFQFLLSLFDSDEDTLSYPKLYHNVAVKILSQFCLIPEMLNDREMLNFIPHLVEILKSFTDDDDNELVNDVLKLISVMVENDHCHTKLLELNILNVLFTRYKMLSGDKTLVVLMLLIVHPRVIDNIDDLIKDLLRVLSENFLAEKTMQKFEICNFLITLQMKYSLLDLETSYIIQKSLMDILGSKIGKEQRDPALKLAGIIVHKFGSQWFAEDSETSKSFFTILVQITSVEICMLLEDNPIEEVCKEIFLLTSCYCILERIIGIMVEESLFQSNRLQLEPLLNSINMSFQAIINFIKHLYDEHKSDISYLFTNGLDAVITGTIRVLCAWLAEETFALQEEIIEILPFVLDVCKRPIVLEEKEVPNCKFIQFFIAPLCHLTAEEKSRQVLLENDLLAVIFEHFYYLWDKHQSNPTAEIVINICTVCGILLNMVVFERDLVAKSDEFFVFLKFLFNSLPQAASKPGMLTLRANFAALGLLITRQLYKRVKICETSFYGFFSSSIAFLWDAHNTENINDVMSFTVSGEYREVWSDIMELWFLGMHTLSALLPLMPWIPAFLIESGWPATILRKLAIVSEKGIECDVKCTYEAFFSAMAKENGFAADNLLKIGAISICKKHKMAELEALLLKHTESSSDAPEL